MTEQERTALINIIVGLYAGARDNYWRESYDLAELVSGDPWGIDATHPEYVRQWLEEKLATA